MRRVKRALMVAGLSVAAAVVGYALGLVFAPASGQETRRRWARRAEDELSSMTHACERMFERVSGYARREIDERKKQIAEAMAHKGC